MASDLTVQFMPYLLVVLGGGLFGLRRYYASEGGRGRIDRSALKVPFVGPVLRKIAVARFCRTLSTLIASGVPILEGWISRLAPPATRPSRTPCSRRGRVSSAATTISGPLRQTGVFPGMVVQMIAVGEATGALDTMLAKIADFYEEEVDTAVAGMLSLLEPIMIAFLGIVVGGIVISMYLPIFGLISELAG